MKKTKTKMVKLAFLGLILVFLCDFWITDLVIYEKQAIACTTLMGILKKLAKLDIG